MARIAAGVLIGLVSFTCHAQVKVFRDKSEKDDQRRTILAIPAIGAYQSAAGTSVRPELRVECLHKEETVQFIVEETDEFAVVLDAGPLETAGSGVVSLRVKLDDGQPTSHQWAERPDHRSYSYDRYPGPEPDRDRDLTSDARKLLEDVRVQTDTSKFLEDIFSAKTIRIEFQPLKGSRAVEGRFDASGLRKEFDKYPECRAYYRTSH
jgi:hypothetical protein